MLTSRGTRVGIGVGSGKVGRPPRIEPWAFYALLAISVLPTLLFASFPSEDGGLHVASAGLYLDQGLSTFQDYYEFVPRLVPNLTADIILAALLVVLPATIAMKVLLLVFAVGVPLAVRWCLTVTNPASKWLSSLAIPMGQGLLLYLGFLNFQIGVVLSLITFAYWHRWVRPGEGSRAVRTLGLGVLMLFVALSHPVPFLATLLLIGASVIDDLLTGPGGETWTRGLRRVAGPAAAASLVPLVLVAVFMLGQEGDVTGGQGVWVRLMRLPSYVVHALSAYEIPIGWLLTATIGLLVVAALFSGPAARRWRAPGLLGAAVLLLVLYFVAPGAIGEGSSISSRIALYLSLCILLWLGGRPVPRWVPATAVVLAAVIVVGLTAVRLPTHQVLNEDVSEYLSGATALEPGSTVLPLWLTDIEAGRGPGGGERLVRPLVEALGMVTHESQVVDLHHLHGSLPLSMFSFAPGRDIRDTAADGSAFPFVFGPGMVDIDEFEDAGGTVDYVWLWGRAIADETLLESDQAREVLETIDGSYELVFTSEPRGLLEVYEKVGTDG